MKIIAPIIGALRNLIQLRYSISIESVTRGSDHPSATKENFILWVPTRIPNKLEIENLSPEILIDAKITIPKNIPRISMKL